MARFRMVPSSGVPKGLHWVLEERGVTTYGINGDEIQKVLRKYPDLN